MNRRHSTLLLVLLLAAALPCAADDPPKSHDMGSHSMAPEARRIEGEVPEEFHYIWQARMDVWRAYGL